MKRRTILYVSHETACGGAERSLLTLLGALDRDRFAPLLATSGEGLLAQEARALDVVVHRAPMLHAGRWRKAFGLLRAAAVLRALVVAEHVALVHTNSLIGGYCGLLAARQSAVPCVWHVRDIGYPALAAFACSRAERVIAVSTAAALALPARLQRSPRLQIVPNAVSDAFFARDAHATLRAELGVEASTPLVGMLGRLDPRKGHREFLVAASLVHQSHPRAAFVIAGDALLLRERESGAGYRQELQAAASALGLGSHVHFLGHRSDAAAVVASLDVVVQPSTEPESFGRTVVEAQAAGKAVVATPLGGVAELIEDRVTGMLVPPGNAPALAEGIASLLENEGLRRALGSQARRVATQRFTAGAHAARIAAIYDEILGPDPST